MSAFRQPCLDIYFEAGVSGATGVMDEQRGITFILFSSQYRSDNGRHRVHDHRLDRAAAAGRLTHTRQRQPSLEGPPLPGLKTHLLQRAGTERVQTVQQREDVKQAEDVDPLKSFHLCRQAEDASCTRSEKSSRPGPTHLLFSPTGFSFQHLQQASGSQPPGRVHKHHALLQMVRDVHGGSKAHLRRPLQVYGGLLAAD